MKKIPWLFLIIITIAAIAVIYLAYQNTQLKQQMAQQYEILPSPSPYINERQTQSPTTALQPTNTPTGTSCANKTIGVSVLLPNNSWTCKNEEAGGYAMDISSKTLTLHISTLGRGEYCSPSDLDPSSPRYDPNPNGCVVTDFFNNDLLNLKLYTSNGTEIEIFGTIDNGPTLSVSHISTTKSDFSEEEKTTIRQILSTVSKR